MAEDQSVLGRRQIYYDPHGNETLICSDSEGEFVEAEDEKHDFTEGEDQMLWKVVQEHGLNQDVMHILCQSIDATPDEIEERCEILLEKYQEIDNKRPESPSGLESKSLLDKTLNAALDSFDNLFCRRCLMFDCRLHGCSQTLAFPSEKQPYGNDLEENKNPCSEECYLRVREHVRVSHIIPNFSSIQPKDSNQADNIEVAFPLESEDSNPDEDDIANLATSEGLCSHVDKLTIVTSETVENNQSSTLDSSFEIEAGVGDLQSESVGNVSKRKILKHDNVPDGKSNSTFGADVGPADKKQKKQSTSDVSPPSKEIVMLDSSICSIPDSKCQILAPSLDSTKHPSKTDHHGKNRKDKGKKLTEFFPVRSLLSSTREPAKGWSIMEKDLYLKGVEIFGKNSCLIARNLLSGMKTCVEVSKYMFNGGASLQSRPLLSNSCLENSGRCDNEQDIPLRTRVWRKRGRAKKLKYTWKSAGHPSIRKRIGDGKQQPCKQYTPCGCQQICGKQCTCMENGTCCEKYCGCSKSCKNRFRGCHCAKSQCRSRQCPCFAAGRECDPDVCRNCWVSCGDGSLGEPLSRGDGYQCGNMKLLLKQQQRILLARSDVAGWGAFIKNPVNKNDYLGEYTGELISHKEADKRGKIYDRANSSFLFDLNDQFVLDAYRKGDKLKFANHSSNPNCYAKVMLVAGDHRVGIYAKEHIEAGEELFYDYRYGPDQAPAWARKPEGSRRDDSSVSHYRAKKIA